MLLALRRGQQAHAPLGPFRPQRRRPVRSYSATIAHFEPGDLYLDGALSSPITPGRLVCALFAVDLADREERDSVVDGLRAVLGGGRFACIGDAHLAVSLELNSHATKLAAVFSVSGWMGPPGFAETILLPAHWETDDPEAVAMAKGYLFGDCHSHILLDWLKEHVPGNLAPSFARVSAEACRVAPV